MTKYIERIRDIHQEIGIPGDYEKKYGLVLQYEEIDLIDIGNDVFGRAQKLSKKASESWKVMKNRAKKEGVVLNVVSAFRSVDKQVRIIQGKLDRRQPISKILAVCAAPGYSEHHTGRALDLNAPGCEPLSELFELTDAFNWLKENARLHAFKLSYPRGNSCGISYEPWHWAYFE